MNEANNISHISPQSSFLSNSSLDNSEIMESPLLNDISGSSLFFDYDVVLTPINIENLLKSTYEIHNGSEFTLPESFINSMLTEFEKNSTVNDLNALLKQILEKSIKQGTENTKLEKILLLKNAIHQNHIYYKSGKDEQKRKSTIENVFDFVQVSKKLAYYLKSILILNKDT
jgi:hypothetical protein